MSIDKLLRIKIWSKVLLIISVVLFLIGIGVIFGPALIHESDMNQDALEYSELSEETKTETSVDSNLMVDETADESLPQVTLVPPLEISDIPAGNNTLQELLEQSNEDTVTNDHVETKPNQDRRNDGDAADGSDTVENQKPSSNTSSPENTSTARDLKALKAQNSDFAGWLSIAGTKVDYPVVCSDNTDYYLTHTFNGTKSSLGTLFSLGKTDYGSSKNIAIYGHHITGSGQKMFKPLLSYKDKSFWSEHRTITLDTLSGKRTYTMFAVINMENDEWDPSTADFVSNDEFAAFVNRAKDQALYDTGVSVSASDRILTLITCDRSYAGKDGRLLVMAVEQ